MPGRDLDAGAFAFVMATGIVAIAAAEKGRPLLSDALLAVACLAWLVLATTLALRAPTARRSGTIPRPRLQAFAIVAATAVIGSRLAQAGDGVSGLALWALAVTLWLLLLLLRPAIGEPRGGSLLVVVATESLAVLAALLAPVWGRAFLVVAFAGWLLGLAVYPAVIFLIVRGARRRPRFEPDLWIVMGALAIATLAGSELLVAARTFHAFPGHIAWLHDADLVTWACASALIVPLLLAELATRSRWRYQPSRWSFVFPLGMYAVASDALAAADGHAALGRVGSVFFVVALAAWALVAAGMSRRALAVYAARGFWLR